MFALPPISPRTFAHTAFLQSGANSTDSHLASCAPPIGRLRKMSVKLAVVLLIALQASLCLCQLPEPEQELQDKYKNLKASAEKRISVAIGKFKELIHPLVEDSVVTQSAKERVEELQENPHFQSFVKIVTGIAQEMTPLIDKLRNTVLGLYGEYLRPHIGTHLDQGIKHVQYYLDSVAPVN